MAQYTSITKIMLRPTVFFDLLTTARCLQQQMPRDFATSARFAHTLASSHGCRYTNEFPIQSIRLIIRPDKQNSITWNTLCGPFCYCCIFFDISILFKFDSLGYLRNSDHRCSPAYVRMDHKSKQNSIFLWFVKNYAFWLPNTQDSLNSNIYLEQSAYIRNKNSSFRGFTPVYGSMCKFAVNLYENPNQVRCLLQHNTHSFTA